MDKPLYIDSEISVKKYICLVRVSLKANDLQGYGGELFEFVERHKQKVMQFRMYLCMKGRDRRRQDKWHKHRN